MATLYEIKIDQGATLHLPFIFADENDNPLNLTGYTSRMQLRTSYTSPTPAIELTTENNRIIISPFEGKITLTLPASVTATLIASKYVYDLEIVSSSGFVTRVLQGDAIINPEVTR